MTLFATDGPGHPWWQLVAALMAGAVSGIGSFYVAAQPEVRSVEEQSLASDVLLCEAANENRLLFRRVVDALVQTEDVPPDADPWFRSYIERRNDRRVRGRLIVDDATRPLDCNHGALRQ